MTLDEDALLATATRLASTVGLAQPVALQRLPGGKNNRVFRVALAAGGPVVLKSYHADPRDSRDRLKTEYGFLAYAWARGVRSTPQPLAWEQETRSALYSFLPGQKLTAGQVSLAHLHAAADFVRDLNTAPREPLSLPPGSESCFTLADHLATVERRVHRLAAIDPDTPLRDHAEDFVAQRLEPAWHGVQQRITRDAKDLGISLDAKLDIAEICISPSDFGFHNALCIDEAHVAFIDFEYAGHDDPAKLACDFFCQPEVPVPVAYFDEFVRRLATDLGLPDTYRTRCRILLDAYRVKWACIILNDFLPMDAARRAFAHGGGRTERCTNQLAKAAEKIQQLGLR